ncbi:MAG: alanine--tRNA ligase-related protein, partial [Terriglobia bacterium]
KVIRRAIDHGRQLDLEKPFLFEMAGRVAELMREPYPELLDSLQRVATVIKGEEEKYARLIIPAVKALEVYRADEMHQQDSVDVRMFPVTGAQLFYAYDTHGLRPDFVLDLAKQRGWPVERDAEIKFQKELGKQRERAKASWKAVEKAFAEEVYRKWSEKYRTTFLGHTHTKVDECRILAMVEKQRPKLVKDEKMSAEVSKKVYPEFEILLDQTPFYAEAGGQVGDTGWMLLEGEVVARVVDTYSPIVGLVAHRVELLGNASPETLVDRRVTAQVDASRRSATMRNHTGTHLLHAALRNVLGPHVKQSGSLVAPDRLRFDFTHYAALDPEELSEIERLANEQILRDVPVQEERLDLDAALKSGALAFFGDKYPEKNVRVITVPDPGEEAGFYSKELCGGTHVRQTGQIGVLKVVSEASVAAGVRRVEAVTGTGALREYQQAQETLQQLAAALHVSEAETLEAVTRLAQQVKQLEKQLGKAKHRSAHRQADELVGRVRQVRDVGVLAAVVQDVDRNTMRSLVDSLRQKLGSGVIVLGTSADGKVALIAAVTKDLTKRVHAGKLVKEVAGRVRGSGGGRADLAEAGGKDPGQLRQALEDVYAIVEKML